MDAQIFDSGNTHELYFAHSSSFIDVNEATYMNKTSVWRIFKEFLPRY